VNWDLFFTAFEKIGSRYFGTALFAFVLFYILFRRKWLYQKIQQRFPKNKDYIRELAYSLSTMLVFSLIIVVLNSPSIGPFTTRYKEIDAMGKTTTNNLMR